MSIQNLANILDNSVKSLLNKSSNTAKGPDVAQEDVKKTLDDIYSISSDDWYSAKPYGFKFQYKQKNRYMVMFLPIGPSNININTNFATNIIPTLYGTVEEHSPVRYYDISIEGTTGMAPKYISPKHVSDPAEASKISKDRTTGRSSFTVSKNALGIFPKTLNLVQQTIDKAADILSSPKTELGVNNDNSGYVAFHNLYRFLLLYKKNILEESEEKEPLIFFNYKDNNEYYVTIKNFSLRRSAENPMLYYYSIQMRAYNLRSIGGNKIEYDLKNRIKELGLDGVTSSSLFGEFKSVSNKAKSGMALIKGVGRSVGR